mgnify:FL=1
MRNRLRNLFHIFIHKVGGNMKKNVLLSRKSRIFLLAVTALASLYATGCSDIAGSGNGTESSERTVTSGYDTSLSGYYYIKNAYSGKYLDVTNGGSSNGTNIQQYEYNGSTAQQFNLVYIGSGYYAIKTVCSGSAQALDVWSKSTADGTNIATYAYSGGTNQQFKFVKNSDGSYGILTRISGDASGLDDYGWSTSNGGNVVQWNYWGGTCQNWILTPVTSSSSSDDFMRGVDVSALYALEEDGASFYETDSSSADMLTILANHGVNWVRLRVWNTPTNANYTPMENYGYCDIKKAASVAARAKALGMKVLLDFHYSDTWADPSLQCTPRMWDSYTSASALASAAATWTKNCLIIMKNAGGLPDMVQVGNEINTGIMTTSSSNGTASVACAITGSNFQTVMSTIISTIRSYNSGIDIMLHLAQGGYASVISYAYTYLSKLDFDVLGLSYYPFFESHKTITNLKSVVETYVAKGKRVVVAETSFPWTVEQYANDNVSNSVWYYNDANDTGLSSAYTNLKSVASTYGITTSTYNGYNIIAASAANQKAVLAAIIDVVKNAGGEGVFYWGGEWVAGNSIGSTWENQALFDLNHKALSVLDAFNE